MESLVVDAACCWRPAKWARSDKIGLHACLAACLHQQSGQKHLILVLSAAPWVAIAERASGKGRHAWLPARNSARWRRACTATAISF
jgi:hypothetical protein